MCGETGRDWLGQFNGCQAGVAAEVCVCWRGGLLHLAPRLFTQQGVGVSGWVSGWMGGGCEWVTEQQMVGGRSQRSHLVMSL